jgi:thiol-disulfide isomerase/thioredoxin
MIQKIGHCNALIYAMRGRDLALIAPPLLLGVLLAASNLRLVRENRRLSDTAQYYASLRHTPAGIKLPDLFGKGLDGQDLTISYKDGNRETLLFVFSPTCPHCKRNWPVWLDLARGPEGKRVVFVNVGGQLPPKFSQSYSFDAAAVIAETSPDSILQYSLFEFPITMLVSADGHSEKVWVGELDSTEVTDIKKLLARS